MKVNCTKPYKVIRDLIIFCDGYLLKDCIEADSEESYAICLIRNEYDLIICNENHEPKMYVLRGHIKFKKVEDDYMSVAKLCEKYGFEYDLFLDFIRIKSKFDIWYIEKDIDFNEREIEVYHGNSVNRQEFKKSISKRNNFNINQNCIWHKQKTPKMNLDEVFEYLSGHDRKYFE